MLAMKSATLSHIHAGNELIRETHETYPDTKFYYLGKDQGRYAVLAFTNDELARAIASKQFLCDYTVSEPIPIQARTATRENPDEAKKAIKGIIQTLNLERQYTKVYPIYIEPALGNLYELRTTGVINPRELNSAILNAENEVLDEAGLRIKVLVDAGLIPHDKINTPLGELVQNMQRSMSRVDIGEQHTLRRDEHGIPIVNGIQPHDMDEEKSDDDDLESVNKKPRRVRGGTVKKNVITQGMRRKKTSKHNKTRRKKKRVIHKQSKRKINSTKSPM
jgi:hypothetical protein